MSTGKLFRPFYLLLILLCCISSCSNPEAENKRFNYQLDSLSFVLNSRDSAIDDLLNAFTEVQRSLDTVAERQKRVSLKVGEQSMFNTTKAKITEDIRAINEIIAANEERIRELESKLGTAGRHLKTFKQMIAGLNRDIEAKNAESAALNQRLNALSIQVIQLQASVDYLSTYAAEQNERIVEKTDLMNEAFYVIGKQKDLLEKKIIDKKGGILGLGKTTSIHPLIDTSAYTRIDIRQATQLYIHGSSPFIVTPQPSGSYSLEKKDKNNYVLHIQSPTEFWTASKYLVVVVK
jgi:hypothetical protein